MCCRVLCVGGRALGVSDQDYPSVCAAEYFVLGAEPLVYLIKIIQRRVLQCLCVGGRALGVPDQDYPSVCAAVYCVSGAEPLVYLIKIIQACVLMCTVCRGQSPWCI